MANDMEGSMKNWLIVLVILIVISVGIVFSVKKMPNSGDASKSIPTSNQETTNVDKSEETDLSQEQTQEFEGVTFDLGLSESSDEREVIAVMHHMTHQKVKAHKKWVSKPMIPDTIEQVYTIISQSNFKRKDELLEIAERWRDGDFSRADKDHNYFWEYQDGTVGKAYGLMSETEERKFIIDEFGEEYLPE